MRAKVRTYWQVGNYINQHLKTHGGRAEYGKQVIVKLAKDLKTEETILQRCSKFAEIYPSLEILAGRQELVQSPLTWSHYRALITVDEDDKRESLRKRAIQYGWNAERLEEEIFSKPPQGPKRAVKPSFLKPIYGQLGTYKMITKAEAGWAAPQDKTAGGLLLDYGFRVYRELDKKDGIRSSGLVHFENDRLVKSDRTEKDRYFYEALIEKILDGDTFWTAIEIGFSHIARQKLRLRAVDAAELPTPQGRKAQRFLECLLPARTSILLKTSEWPNFDRYVADVFVPVSVDLNGACQKILKISDPNKINEIAKSCTVEIEKSGSFYFLNNLLLALGLAILIRKKNAA